MVYKSVDHGKFWSFVKSPLFVFYFLSSYDGPRTKVLSCYLYIVRTYFTPFAYPD